MNNKIVTKSEVLNIACSWLSLAIPWITPVNDSVEGIRSFYDKVLFDKLANILSNQDSDFNEWLKISEKFDENNSAYNKMVKQLIYYINAINEADLLYAFSNLLRAYKCGLICKNDFFRLGSCLTRLLAEDAVYLAENIHRGKIAENIYCIALANNGLMYNKSRGFVEDDEEAEENYYCFTDMGKMIDKYALNYGNEERYKYGEPDAALAKQKLVYTKNNIGTLLAGL